MDSLTREPLPRPETWVRYRHEGMARKAYAPPGYDCFYHLSPATVMRRDGFVAWVADERDRPIYFISAVGERRSPREKVRAVDLFSSEADAFAACQKDFVKPTERKPNPAAKAPRKPKVAPADESLRHAALGQALAAFVASPAFYRIITSVRPEDPVARGARRGLGTRFLVAEAFAIWAGPAAELMALRGQSHGDEEDPIEDVLVCIAGWCFDSEGDRDGAGAAPRAGHRRHRHWISPLEREELNRHALGARSDPKGRVIAALAAALGSPDSWGIPREGVQDPWARVTVRTKDGRGLSEIERLLAAAPGAVGVEMTGLRATAVMPAASTRSLLTKLKKADGVDEDGIAVERITRAVPGAALGATLWDVRHVGRLGFGPFDRS